METLLMNCNPHSHRQRRALQTQIEREVKTFFRAAGVESVNLSRMFQEPGSLRWISQI